MPFNIDANSAGNGLDVGQATGGSARARNDGLGSGTPRYFVESLELVGLEALWSIALEVQVEDVSEAAIKKLCEVGVHAHCGLCIRCAVMQR